MDLEKVYGLIEEQNKKLDKLTVLLVKNLDVAKVILGNKEKLTIREAALYMDQSEINVRKWVTLGLLQATRPGGKVLYVATDSIRDFLSRHPVEVAA